MADFEEKEKALKPLSLTISRLCKNEAEGARTLNLRIDSPMLYPIELRPHHLNHKLQYISPLAFMSNVFMQNHSSWNN